MKPYSIFILVVSMLIACQQRRDTYVAPWGGDEKNSTTQIFDLNDIENAGELIALTISGPTTYYDCRGNKLGVHTMLCQQFADSLGVRLRIVLCRDTNELSARLNAGEGDLIAYPIHPLTDYSPGWRVADQKTLLRKVLESWYHPDRMKQVIEEEKKLVETGGQIKRMTYSPLLNKQGGIISHYDALFKKYCQTIRWDWRLMAAQCYQESTFDPDALSWAGARGLMQIMPETADHLGVSRNLLNQPAHNIAAASRYIKELESQFSDIPSKRERQDFVLAAYNGGSNHIRDAMALARADGRDDKRWSVISEYVIKLSLPQYYQQPVVRYGYMRGQETVDYVRQIRKRYQDYKGVKGGSGNGSLPQKSRNERHRQKYKI